MAKKAKAMSDRAASAKRKSLKKEGKSGIVIKPQNKGKFTEYKKRTGKTTAEALQSKDPHVRKMAQFAQNARKWKKGK